MSIFSGRDEHTHDDVKKSIIEFDEGKVESIVSAAFSDFKSGDDFMSVDKVIMLARSTWSGGVDLIVRDISERSLFVRDGDLKGVIEKVVKNADEKYATRAAIVKVDAVVKKIDEKGFVNVDGVKKIVDYTPKK